MGGKILLFLLIKGSNMFNFFILKIKLIHKVQGETISVQFSISIFNKLLESEKRNKN